MIAAAIVVAVAVLLAAAWITDCVCNSLRRLEATQHEANSISSRMLNEMGESARKGIEMHEKSLRLSERNVRMNEEALMRDLVKK